MKKHFFIVLLPAFFLFLVNGCGRVRTYTVQNERVDQNLSSGNSGYLMGSPSKAELERPRKLTRKTYVAEIEVGKYEKKKRIVRQRAQRMAVETAVESESESEPIMEDAPQEEKVSGKAQDVSFYTVEPNDTLGKISIKVYGSAKKWKKIFEANADQLKTPDKIYAGQVLKIPGE